ncbi:MAG: hypothetical protein HY000_18550, partial [Planctomycetes bacterium]|nr:hypothetical protein [Planctomycetota bacterium]
MNREHLLSCVRHPAAILSLALALLVPRVAVLAQQNLPSTRPDEPVAEVRVRGNHNVTTQKIMAEIRSRPGMPPDEKLLQEDVRRLIATRQFFDVGVEYLHEPHGLVVLFRVLEGNQIREVVFEGNRAFDAEKLREKANLYPDKKASDKKSEKKPDPKKPLAIDIARAKDAARTLEDFYHEKGYAFAKVELVEGMQPGDKRLLFRVSEGPQVAVTDIDFEFLDHNTFGEGRLKTQIKSKARKFGFLGGRYNPREIEDDIQRLGSYYRSLGFFDAKISRELRESEDRSKVEVLFVIQ